MERSPADEITIEEFVTMFCADLLDKVVRGEEERQRREEMEIEDFVHGFCSDLLNRVVEDEGKRRRLENREMTDFARKYCVGIIQAAVDSERRRIEKERAEMEEFVTALCADLLDKVVADEEERRRREEMEIEDFVHGFCSDLLDRVVEDEEKRRRLENREIRDFARKYCVGIIEAAVDSERRRIETERAEMEDFARTLCNGIIEAAVEEENRRRDMEMVNLTALKLRDEGKKGDFSDQDQPIPPRENVPTTADGDKKNNLDEVPSGELGNEERTCLSLASSDKTTKPDAFKDSKGATKPKKRIFKFKKGGKSRKTKPCISKALANVFPVSSLMVPEASGHVTPIDRDRARLITHQKAGNEENIVKIDQNQPLNEVTSGGNSELQVVTDDKASDIQLHSAPADNDDNKRKSRWTLKLKRGLLKLFGCTRQSTEKRDTL